MSKGQNAKTALILGAVWEEPRNVECVLKARTQSFQASAKPQSLLATAAGPSSNLQEVVDPDTRFEVFAWLMSPK